MDAILTRWACLHARSIDKIYIDSNNAMFGKRNTTNQEDVVAGGNVVGRDLIFNLHIGSIASLDSGQINAFIRQLLVESGAKEFEKDAIDWKEIEECSSEWHTSYESIIKTESPIEMNEANISALAHSAALAIKSLDFGKAHRCWAQALPLIPDASSKKLKAQREFYLTGLIYFASINDVARLNTFVGETKIGRRIDLLRIASDALQERGTRELDGKQLKSTARTIEQLYERAPEKLKSLLANSLGLAYRRLGERGEIALLEKAVAVFDDGLLCIAQDSLFDDGFTTANTLFVELNNNAAIAYIRMFELTSDEVHLDSAEDRLRACLDRMSTTSDFRDQRNYMIAPNVHNNLGNLSKQRYINASNILFALDALEHYGTAESLWTKEQFPYFWAVVQKNIGHTKFLMSKLNQDRNLMIEAMKHCLDSLVYRDKSNSPHQWLKSVEIVFGLVQLSPDTFSRELERGGIIEGLLAEIVGMGNSSEYEKFESLSQNIDAVKQLIRQA